MMIMIYDLKMKKKNILSTIACHFAMKIPIVFNRFDWILISMVIKKKTLKHLINNFIVRRYDK